MSHFFKQLQPSRIDFCVLASLTLGAVVCILLYWPGLNSRFVLDDQPNLYLLQALNYNPSWDSFFFYVLQGTSGELGRPLSLASFALHFYAWPNDPQTFKFTNLMLHLITGLVLFYFLTRLLQTLKFSLKHQYYLATAVCVVWLLHPLQVSTVLYTVQRMAQLSSLFILISLCCYLNARRTFVEQRLFPAWSYSAFAFIIAPMLAVLSKENGVLVYIFIILLEFTLKSSKPVPRIWKILLALLVYTPLVLGLVYFVFHFDTLVLNGYREREFSLYQRLLSQPRALLDYLGNILFIKWYNYGVYHDDFVISTSLFQPVSTFLSLLTVLGLLFYGFTTRQRVVRFCLLWFFAAHSLESSVFPLELYFEHRNYLALISPILLLGWALLRLIPHLQSHFNVRVLGLGLASWTGLLIWVCYQQTHLWAQPKLQIAVWAHAKPNSIRAQFAYIQQLVESNQTDLARQQLKRLLIKFPTHTGLLMSLMSMQCQVNNPSPVSQDALLQALALAKYRHGYLTYLNALVNLKIKHRCQTITSAQLQRLFNVVLANSSLASSFADVHGLQGRWYLSQRQLTAAQREFELALSLRTDIKNALALAYLCRLRADQTCHRRALKRAELLSYKRWRQYWVYAPIIKKLRQKSVKKTP